MSFTSLAYALFLPLVFLAYWGLAKSKNQQNILLVGASYFFYGWWDWRFLGLIFISSTVDFILARKIDTNSSEQKRKVLLISSLVFNLGLLGTFKYYNFFVDSLLAILPFDAGASSILTLKIILPIGISFYTFQTMAYTIDVYRKQIKPIENPIPFFLYVSFFPQLVAGPIERASRMLPQFERMRTFDYTRSVDGLSQILWGLFKKLVIANNCGLWCDMIFNGYNQYSSWILILGAVFFAFQIYGDFSGYSDIAIGTGKLFGISLMQNFATPYFSRDIAEFWKRWHISLTTWFRDYVYIPLGGNRVGQFLLLRNVFLVFLLSGLWHGANWTFVAWGAFHALLFIPLILTNRNKRYTTHVAAQRLLPNLKELFSMLLTFALVSFSWILFRSDNLTEAVNYILAIFSHFGAFDSRLPFSLSYMMLLPLLMLLIEWFQRDKAYGLDFSGYQLSRFTRYAIWHALLICTFFLTPDSEEAFIYFQF